MSMFISFEGTEGVGKTTLIQKLYEHFQQQGKQVVLTREPGGTPLAEQIRSLLLSVNHEEQMSHDTELLLMYAARAQRFVDSSFAYQCAGRGLSREKLQLLNQNFVSKMPDITFWLDAPIELGMNRARARGALDRFEQEKVVFFESVRSGFSEIHLRDAQRMKRLDATQTPEQVFAEALRYLK